MNPVGIEAQIVRLNQDTQQLFLLLHQTMVTVKTLEEQGHLKEAWIANLQRDLKRVQVSLEARMIAMENHVIANK